MQIDIFLYLSIHIKATSSLSRLKAFRLIDWCSYEHIIAYLQGKLSYIYIERKIF